MVIRRGRSRSGAAAPRAKIPSSGQAVRRARGVRLLLVDVDGVLTDGRIYLQSLRGGGAEEMKAFHVHDGTALKLARVAGIKTGLISGRKSAATTRRARELGVDYVWQKWQKRTQKLPAYEAICRRARVEDDQVAYIGDDLPDLPILRRVGLAIAVANAAPEVKRAAHLVTWRHGGDGAVREAVERILKAQGKWHIAVGAQG